MAQKEHTLVSALQAAQARRGQKTSLNPTALSEGLVRTQELPEIDFAAETSAAISNLEEAVETYQAVEGKPNLPLIEAKQAVVLLEAQLEEARKHLKELEAKGSWLDRFNQAVHVAERQVEILRGNYERQVLGELIHLRYGQQVNFASLGSEAKRDLRFHVRVTNLNRFYIARRGDSDVVTPEYLYARAEKVAVTLNALRTYIAEGQKQHAKK
jgi:hypothetical protein